MQEQHILLLVIAVIAIYAMVRMLQVAGQVLSFVGQVLTGIFDNPITLAIAGIIILLLGFALYESLQQNVGIGYYFGRKIGIQ